MPGPRSCLHRPAPEREQALRSLLDKEDEEHEHGDLGEHGARPGLEEFVDDAQAERGVYGARELANAAQHDDHERIDDIALAEIGPHVADLRQSTASQARDPCPETEG